MASFNSVIILTVLFLIAGMSFGFIMGFAHRSMQIKNRIILRVEELGDEFKMNEKMKNYKPYVLDDVVKAYKEGMLKVFELFY